MLEAVQRQRRESFRLKDKRKARCSLLQPRSSSAAARKLGQQQYD